jgi:hypothetical protein
MGYKYFWVVTVRSPFQNFFPRTLEEKVDSPELIPSGFKLFRHDPAWSAMGQTDLQKKLYVSNALSLAGLGEDVIREQKFRMLWRLLYQKYQADLITTESLIG